MLSWCPLKANFPGTDAPSRQNVPKNHPPLRWNRKFSRPGLAYQRVACVREPRPGGWATGDDGVGTSSFKPLAILGGVFGYGLKRNVIDLYKFVCRNHRESDDEIFGFGFSRGA